MRILNHRVAAGLAAIVSAAFCAGALTLTVAGPPAGHSTAGVGMMQLLKDEHALAMRATAEQNDRRRAQDMAADLALTQEKDRAMALADHDSLLRVADMSAAAPVKLDPASHSRQAQRGAVKLARRPALTSRMETPVGPPLSLQAALTAPETAKAQQPDRGLLRRVRDVVATVERVPGWMNDAADWIVDLPAQAIPRRLRAARLNVVL